MPVACCLLPVVIRCKRCLHSLLTWHKPKNLIKFTTSLSSSDANEALAPPRKKNCLLFFLCVAPVDASRPRTSTTMVATLRGQETLGSSTNREEASTPTADGRHRSWWSKRNEQEKCLAGRKHRSRTLTQTTTTTSHRRRTVKKKKQNKTKPTKVKRGSSICSRWMIQAQVFPFLCY